MKKQTPSSLSGNALSGRISLGKGGERRLSRLVLLLALIAPAIDTLLLFPLSQIILSNSSGTGVLYEIFSQIVELYNLTTFFLLLGLAVYCALIDQTKLLGRIVALHGIASVFVVVLLRILLYYLLALLDSTYLVPFELCNQTLNSLTTDGGAQLMALGLSLFISQVILFALLGLMAMLALRARQKALEKKADLSPVCLRDNFDSTPIPKLLRLGLILFAVVALINSVFDTVMTLIDIGAPAVFSDLMSLIVPYFLLAIHCLVCYLALEYGVRYFTREGAKE